MTRGSGRSAECADRQTDAYLSSESGLGLGLVGNNAVGVPSHDGVEADGGEQGSHDGEKMAKLE